MSVMFTGGPDWAREAASDDPPFTGLRHVGFVLPRVEAEPRLWEGDQA